MQDSNCDSLWKYVYMKMPFGLVNATSTFQRLMDRVLESMHDFCAACVDDILIYSGTWKVHVKHLGEVFNM